MKIQTLEFNKLGQENAVRVFMTTGRAFYFGGVMKVCQVEGCERKHHAKGYCSNHYAQTRKHGKVLKRTCYDPNEIIIKDDMAEIVLYNIKNQEVARAIVDAEDVEKIKEHKWGLGNGYAVTRSKNKLIKLQHIIVGIKATRGRMIDHKDRNRLNNRKSNYRFCTHAQNTRNAGISSNNTSGFKGVFWCKESNKWRAQIKTNYKNICLGRFISKLKAAKAYNKAAIKYHGEFAYLNKI